MSQIWNEILPLWMADLDARMAICWSELETIETELNRITRGMTSEGTQLADHTGLDRLTVLVDLINAEVERIIVCRLDAQFLAKDTNQRYDV